MVITQKVLIEHRLVGTLDFVEPIGFYDDWKELDLTDSDLGLLQVRLMEKPDAGRVIEGTGGARKVRFERKRIGKGKSGGARVIYVHFKDRNAIAMLVAYGKDVKDNLSEADKKAIKSLIAEIKKVIPLKGKKYGKRS